MSTESKFEIGWALVELMGHQRIVGRASEQAMAGGAFLRVDVPEVDGQPAFTRFYGAAAIYCISPIHEDIARQLIENCRPEPVSRFELPQIANKVAETDDGYGDPENRGL